MAKKRKRRATVVRLRIMRPRSELKDAARVIKMAVRGSRIFSPKTPVKVACGLLMPVTMLRRRKNTSILAVRIQLLPSICGPSTFRTLVPSLNSRK